MSQAFLSHLLLEVAADGSGQQHFVIDDVIDDFDMNRSAEEMRCARENEVNPVAQIATFVSIMQDVRLEHSPAR